MISIIIPTRSLKRKKNIKHLLKPISSLPDLVEDIEKNISVDYEVIIVVNGMEDRDLLKYLDSKKTFKIIYNNKNVGVSRAWNMGRHYAEGKYLLYLNDDVRLEKKSVETMLDVFEKNEKNMDEIRIDLKYSEGSPVIRELKTVSKPGRRTYSSVKAMPRVHNGLGVSIITTPRGVMTDSKARSENVGGEVLCQVF